MKKKFNVCPSFLQNKEFYGFNWLEHVTAIPSPLVLVTSYKTNGKSNACMQSWLTFSNDKDFYCIFASVNKKGHMYSTIKDKKQLVINFPSVDIYKKCLSTIKNNKYEDDEILLSGLNYKKSESINAPIIEECFLNLECEYAWEKELYPNSDHVVMCVRVLNILMDESYYDVTKNGRYGNKGYLYNIHSPLNPISGKEEETYVGTINKYKTYSEL